MNRAAFLLVALAVVAAGVWFWRDTGGDVSSAQGAERIVLGQKLYAENCASCHGANLEGQPDWKSRKANGRLPAPPHDASGHTWHHSDEQLFAITKLGTAALVGKDYESDMIGFGDILGDDEIRAVLDYIKSTWPEREAARQRKVSGL
ncbi:MAG: cytochrome c [Pseudaminobacter sp.]|jgi:mono/diheme cytochrome c family protein|uniref:Cytochrome C n=1 Tax=Aquamicrobium defluvii TaxID=69279 RepID=A0A011UP04_9HYPH|nr:cytochrome c [Aquamicrobium defluvii]EXL07886.1 cytochrome C [Aquamicrobium defluvii]EZQ14941.1 cytochrome C [Halopseudomonas bauzanensis]TDR34898.1 cytochrome c [Aquamicrobium defluvii]